MPGILFPMHFQPLSTPRPPTLLLLTLSASRSLRLGRHRPACTRKASRSWMSKTIPVVLRGINLGGWLVEEPWMMPIQTKPPTGSDLPPIRDNRSLWAVVEARLGDERPGAGAGHLPAGVAERGGF